MKKIFAVIFIGILLVSACTPSIQPVPSESTPTLTQNPPTAIATNISSTPSLTPASTISLPVSQLTPVPSSSTKITAENVQDLQEIAKYYGEINYLAKLTKDKKFLFILDPEGLTKYDYSSMESMAYVTVVNSVSDLQISDNGDFLIIDNLWLLNLRNDKEPQLTLLSQEIETKYYPTFTLSPNGSILAVSEYKCYDGCTFRFQIVNTIDFSVLYVWNGADSQGLHGFQPTFSSDGSFIATENPVEEIDNLGNGKRIKSSINIWSTSDLKKVASVKVGFPYFVNNIAFSEDNTQIAITQTDFINIYDVASGDSKVTIDGLCKSYLRKVMFSPYSTIKVLEHSDCSSGEWTISGSTARLSSGNVPDLSRIAFDEKGNFKAIPYIQPASELKAYRKENYFKFLNNNVLSFKNFDAETLDRHSCDLSLANGSFDCQSHAPEYSNGRFLGKDVILATDGKYYSYVVGKSKVDIYSFDNPSQIYYSIPFRDYTFDLLALDSINNLVFYNIAISGSANRIIIQDMENDSILEKWEGETFISSIVFSENNRFVGICRGVGYDNSLNSDRLMLFDISEKRITYNMDFTCSGTAPVISEDGSKLAAGHYLYNPTNQLYSTRIMILNTTSPFEKQYFDFDTLFSSAVSFSPDGSMLAAVCSKNEICFLDSSDGREIYRMKAHSGISNLAFSKDGSMLATSSNWGLISIWAIPPFTSGARQSQPSPILSYTPGFSWDFNEDGNLEGWGEQDWQSAGLTNLKVKNGYLSAIATRPDTELYSNEGFGIDVSKFSKIEIHMRVSAGNSAVIFFNNSSGDWAENKGKYFDIIADNEFHTYIINMGTVSGWKGSINQLRLDLRNAIAGATIDIDYIHLLP